MHVGFKIGQQQLGMDMSCADRKLTRQKGKVLRWQAFTSFDDIHNHTHYYQPLQIESFGKLADSLSADMLHPQAWSLPQTCCIRKHGLFCRHVASASMVSSADMLHPQAWSLPQTCYFRNMVVSASEPVLSCELIRIRMSCELIRIRIFRTRLANMSCSASACLANMSCSVSA
ncbi:hypothetical protein LXL04_007815 [Taraxacum kok-saghyz]